jgi:two-component system CheB/CheR fusion protein
LQPIFGLEHIDDYVQALRAFAHERQAWVGGLLVRVTHFFRDAEAFELLEHEVIPALLRSVSERQTRVQRTNEEFRSVNEALYTVNRAYQHKIQELMQLNDDIGNLLRSKNIGPIFLDTTLQVRKFTPASTSVVPLMPQDIGPSVTHLALPCTNLSLPQELDDVLNRRPRVEKEAMSLAGNWLLLRLLPFISEEGACEGVVLSLIDITRLKTIELALHAEHHFWPSMLSAMDKQIAILIEAGQIVHVNQAWRNCAEANLGADSSYVGLTYIDVYQGVWRVDASMAERLSQGLRDVLTGACSAVAIASRCSSTPRECFVRAIGFASHGPAA